MGRLRQARIVARGKMYTEGVMGEEWNNNQHGIDR